MIAVDTSALMAIVLNEPRALECMKAVRDAEIALISAGTVAEVLIVAERKGVGMEMKNMLESMEFTIVPVTFTTAYLMAAAYQRWGKGIHPAKLNYGDCFSYALADEKKCPLLYVGNDFSQTDILSALLPAH